MIRRRRHQGARTKDPEARTQAATTLRRYRDLLRRAGYRIIGQRVLHAGVPGAHGGVGAYEGARIVGVNLRQGGAPRLVLSWGKARTAQKRVKLSVLA